MEWSGLLILATYHKVLYGILNESDKKVYKQIDIFDSKNNTSDLIYRYLNIMDQQQGKISYIGQD